MNALDASYTDVKLTLLKDISVTVGSGEDWTHIIDFNRTCTLDLAGILILCVLIPIRWSQFMFMGT